MASQDPAKTQNVQVVIRVRPLTTNYQMGKQGTAITADKQLPRCISNINREQEIVLETKDKFTFDFIAGEEVSQDQMFQKLGKPIVDSCI